MSQKLKCKICVKTLSLSNMGEIAVRSHASGKKHEAAVTLSQTGSVSHFFGAKCETKPGLSRYRKTRRTFNSHLAMMLDTHSQNQKVCKQPKGMY